MKAVAREGNIATGWIDEGRVRIVRMKPCEGMDRPFVCKYDRAFSGFSEWFGGNQKGIIGLAVNSEVKESLVVYTEVRERPFESQEPS